MASGYGMHGGVGRCFPFWQEVMACYVVNTSAEDDSGKKKCSPVLEDYYECLHHKKEVACESAGVTSRIRPSSISNPARQCAERKPDTEFGASREDRGHKSGAWAGKLKQ
ncbi:hypothetical protein TGAM01_v207918 [Trichoderma gamsii]|uniref:NADH dehydrogenase [ubiquinone] iron-sulfur protein 5 n=1 Tax=Trichoderma gamsii TaxID=398673 RepID=A0A2P4ZFS7_9HYPO|nr:hypothetical protein TGAM01_v207918 [Trichoderma gamsii]PON23145.1 hypothetical protein TGAM01_v207918 [Trichoderma gamsii]